MNKLLAHRKALVRMLSLLPAEYQGTRSAPARLLRSFSTDTLTFMADTASEYDAGSMRMIADALRDEVTFGSDEFSRRKMTFVLMAAPVSQDNEQEFRVRNTLKAYDEYMHNFRDTRAEAKEEQNINAARGAAILYGMYGLLIGQTIDELEWHGERYREITPLRVAIRARFRCTRDDIQNLIDLSSGDHSPVLAEGAL